MNHHTVKVGHVIAMVLCHEGIHRALARGDHGLCTAVGTGHDGFAGLDFYSARCAFEQRVVGAESVRVTHEHEYRHAIGFTAFGNFVEVLFVA